MAGISIEYDKALNKYGGTVLGSMLGATLGVLASAYTGPGAVLVGAACTILGAGIGAIVGLATGGLKNSNVLTLTATDWEICGAGCTPGIMLQGSGRWYDTDKDQYVLWLHPGDHLGTYSY